MDPKACWDAVQNQNTNHPAGHGCPAIRHTRMRGAPSPRGSTALREKRDGAGACRLAVVDRRPSQPSLDLSIASRCVCLWGPVPPGTKKSARRRGGGPPEPNSPGFYRTFHLPRLSECSGVLSTLPASNGAAFFPHLRPKFRKEQNCIGIGGCHGREGAGAGIRLNQGQLVGVKLFGTRCEPVQAKVAFRRKGGSRSSRK